MSSESGDFDSYKFVPPKMSYHSDFGKIKDKFDVERGKEDLLSDMSYDEFKNLHGEFKVFLVTNLGGLDALVPGREVEVDFHGNKELEKSVRFEDILPASVVSVLNEDNRKYKRRGGKGYYRFGKRLKVFSGTKFTIADVSEGYSSHYSKAEFKDEIEKKKLSDLKKSLSESKEVDPTESFVKFNDDFGRTVVLRKTVAAHFNVARNLARSKGYKLWVDSSYRSFAQQEKLFSNALKKYGSEKSAVRYCAKPGESPHHTGGAIDVFAIPDKYADKYHCPIYDVNGEKIPLYKLPEHTKVLDEVMSSAGFVNYEYESWHYEYGTSRWLSKNKQSDSNGYANASDVSDELEEV